MTDDRVVLEISSTIESLALVDEASARFGLSAGLDEDAAHWLGIAVREAVVNAIKHGNKGDPRKHVRIEYELGKAGHRAEVIVRVRDEGLGFDPARVPDPCAPENVQASSGRGIFLMRTFMDEVQLRRAPDGGTEVVMAKAVPRPLPPE